ncbi:hypothetical protein D922_01405 [Enterococcus faecalis 06-MB-DW-09]|nr:hypothetical protein D931_00867 [Enterococcus faecium 13.SD.W.09]EPH94978.1 hypothetical protein D922_01405 [Enterococcus faecalis 06-MB-DW-09]
MVSSNKILPFIVQNTLIAPIVFRIVIKSGKRSWRSWEQKIENIIEMKEKNLKKIRKTCLFDV